MCFEFAIILKGRTYYVNHNNRTTQWNRPGSIATTAASLRPQEPTAQPRTSPDSGSSSPAMQRQISHTEDNSFMSRRLVTGNGDSYVPLVLILLYIDDVKLCFFRF